MLSRTISIWRQVLKERDHDQRDQSQQADGPHDDTEYG